jgi:hypothetical protein
MMQSLFEQKYRLKCRIIDTCLEQKMRLYAELRRVQKQSVLHLSNLRDPDGPGTPEPGRAELLDALLIGSVQLDALTREIALLKTLRVGECYCQVQPGAVVKTDRLNYLVAVPHPPFTVENEVYTGVSAQSPLLGYARELCQGDAFTVAGCTYLIREVF